VLASAAKPRKKPEEKREQDAEQEGCDDGEINGGAVATMDDVAGEATEAERKSAVKIKQYAEKDEEAAEEQQSAAEFAKGIHSVIVREWRSRRAHTSAGNSGAFG